MALSANPSGKQSDIGFAAVLIAGSVWAYVEAGSYDGFSGTYPRVLAVMLAIVAALVIVRRLAQPAAADEPRLFIDTGRFLLAAAVLVAYIASINLVGYLLPSLAVGVIVPLLLGYRNLRLSFAVTVGTLIFIVAVFYVALARPLPPDLFDAVLGVLR